MPIQYSTVTRSSILEYIVQGVSYQATNTRITQYNVLEYWSTGVLVLVLDIHIHFVLEKA